MNNSYPEKEEIAYKMGANSGGTRTYIDGDKAITVLEKWKENPDLSGVELKKKVGISSASCNYIKKFAIAFWRGDAYELKKMMKANNLRQKAITAISKYCKENDPIPFKKSGFPKKEDNSPEDEKQNMESEQGYFQYEISDMHTNEVDSGCIERPLMELADKAFKEGRSIKYFRFEIGPRAQ